MARTPPNIEPVTVRFVKEADGTIAVHCLRCAHYEDIGFEGLGDDELVIELPRRRNWRCPRCGCSDPSLLSARPEYFFGNRSRELMGLTRKDGTQVEEG